MSGSRERLVYSTYEPVGRLAIRNLPHAWDKTREIEERLTKLEGLVIKQDEA